MYTTLGQTRGCCGHRHLTVVDAGLCLARYRKRQQGQGDYSDRRVVAVADNATWVGSRPTAGVRQLTRPEMRDLYSRAETS